METFEADFRIELEAHVEKRAPSHPIQKAWNPLGVAAPERHLACAAPLGLPFEAVCYQLVRNEAFQQLSSMLHLEFGATALQGVVVEDFEKEQVWLFGYRWFSIYYEELLNVATLRSEFYRKHHSAFLDLLRHACEPVPAKRPTFQELLEIFDPSTKPTPVQTAETVASVSSTAPSDLQPAFVSESVPVVAKSVVGGRLVLNGPVRRVARNKTRRNPCN